MGMSTNNFRSGSDLCYFIFITLKNIDDHDHRGIFNNCLPKLMPIWKLDNQPRLCLKDRYYSHHFVLELLSLRGLVLFLSIILTDRSFSKVICLISF